MKITKRILSTFLAVLMILSVCSAGFTAFAAESSSGSILKEIVLEPVARPSVQFYCTEVTRVAAGVNSVEPGTTIVKATPSGVPELSGSYVSQAYAGETPAATRITFVSPTAGISITGFSCSNETVTVSETSFTAPGTYYLDITGGTATPGEAITFTIDYTWTDGNTYQEKCVSYVEDIATGGAYAEHRVTWKPYNGTSSWYRGYASAITRVLGKGVYYESPADAGMSQQFGSYNVATASFVSGSGLTSYYANEREEKAGLFSNPRETIDHTLFVTGVSQAHIYVDASQTSTLTDINLRIDANVGAENGETHVRNNDTPNVALGESYIVAGAQTSAPTGYSTDVTAQTALGYSIPARSEYGFDSQNGSYSTITSGSRNGGHIITSHLTGNVAGLVDGASYTIINRYYAYFRGSYAYITNSPIVPVIMTFHVVDKGALREMINYVMNSDPDTPAVRNLKKGINPQSWYYKSGFSAFQTQYVEALNLLNNPKATQSEIDSQTTALQKAYNSLQLKTADYTEVNALDKQADAIVENADCYPASDIALIREAQEMVTNNYNILYQPAVDTMAENLRIAIERALPYGANYEEITALDLEYKAMDLSIYTPETIKVVDDAFAKVDYTLSALEQDQVDAWADEIRAAIDGLKPYGADFSTLEATLEEAKAIDRSLYVNGLLLVQHIENAEAAIADNEANPWELSRQPEVDELNAALRGAIDSLILRSVYKVDLKAAIDAEIPGNRDYYDQDILAAYDALVAEGTEMYNDDTLTIYDQKKIDAKTEEITAKYTELMNSYAIPRVDTTALKEILAEVSEINLDLYESDDAMTELLNAVAEGEEIVAANLELNDENTQKVADSVARIQDAFLGLNMKKADATLLNEVLNNAMLKYEETLEVVTYIDGELGTEEKAKYDSAAVKAIIDEIAAVVEGLERGDYFINQVGWLEDFAEEKQAALDALAVLTYPEYLAVAVAEYESYEDPSIYTTDSWGAYETAYNEATALTDAAQADINTALTNLVNAKGELALAAFFDKEEGTTTVIDRENGIIYGLSDEGIEDIEDYIEYAGGTVEYVETDNGFGTGTVVNFMVAGEVYESYEIIIFGDLTGDGVVDTFDYATLAAIVNGDINVEEGSAIYKAADLYVDDSVDTFDLAVLAAYVNGELEISQTPELA